MESEANSSSIHAARQFSDVVRGVSGSIPDPSRETLSAWAWDPGRRLLRSLRLYEQAQRAGVRHALLRKVAVAEHEFWSLVSGADIPLNTRIEIGLLLPQPNGIVMHPDVEIGPNCLIHQQVTLGISGNRPGVPRIRGNVEIGPGAKILGGVTVSRHARIGPNAVVLADVPEGAIASGVPAVVTFD